MSEQLLLETSAKLHNNADILDATSILQAHERMSVQRPPSRHWNTRGYRKGDHWTSGTEIRAITLQWALNPHLGPFRLLPVFQTASGSFLHMMAAKGGFDYSCGSVIKLFGKIDLMQFSKTQLVWKQLVHNLTEGNKIWFSSLPETRTLDDDIRILCEPFWHGDKMYTNSRTLFDTLMILLQEHEPQLYELANEIFPINDQGNNREHKAGHSGEVRSNHRR